jgi:hypothetical protein
LVARYIEVANASQVAAEFGVSVHTVIRSAERAGAARKDKLHAQACARGIREGQRALARTSSWLQQWMAKLGDPDSPGMEPGDAARLATALRGIVAGLVEVDAHRSKVAQAKLTRAKTRAETALLEAKTRGDVQEVVVLTQQQAAERARVVFGSPSALEAGHDGPTDSSSDVVEADALPVSDPMDH